MTVTVTPITAKDFKIISKNLENNIGELEIWGRIETFQTKLLLKSYRRLAWIPPLQYLIKWKWCQQIYRLSRDYYCHVVDNIEICSHWLNKIEFLQAVAVSAHLHGSTTWTVMKRLDEKIWKNCTKRVSAVLKASSTPQNSSGTATNHLSHKSPK